VTPWGSPLSSSERWTPSTSDAPAGRATGLDLQAAMGLALAEAAACAATGDVPVGAVVLDATGVVFGHGRNTREADGDPTAHAEINALRAAAASSGSSAVLGAGSWRLAGATLVVTLEPCVMCAGALVAARVSRLVFGAFDARAGAAGSVWDLVRDRALLHRPEVVAGVRAAESAELLRTFFARRR